MLAQLCDEREKHRLSMLSIGCYYFASALFVSDVNQNPFSIVLMLATDATQKYFLHFN